MNFKMKKERCNTFFDELAKYLEGSYVVVGSCNQDFSRYLVPVGREHEITYHSKPAGSFRISDHWNWYANVKKCRDPHYIQCQSLDAPPTKARKANGYASEPRHTIQVCYFDEDNKYHCVFGEVWDGHTHSYHWKDGDVFDAVNKALSMKHY